MRIHLREREAATNRRTLRRRVRYAVALLPVLATALACSEITNLEQEDPSQILAGTAYVPQNAELLVNGAIGDFECAFYRYTTAAGLLGDELVNAFAFVAGDQYDRRTLPLTGPYAGGCGGHQTPGVYTSLSVARASADTVLARLEVWTDAEMPEGVDRTQLIGKAAAYAGYSLILLGEGMCSAALNVGPELSSTQLFEEAELRFDKAITAATAAGDDETLALARLGRARTLLNLGDVAAAGADAAQVPADFLVVAAANATGTNRQQNTLFAHSGTLGSSNFSSVDPTFTGLTFGGEPDPRVTVIETGTTGVDGQTELRLQTKYGDLGAEAAVARSAEAQLIVAEANVAAGDLPGAVDIINALHAAAGIPPYDGTGQTAEQVLAQVHEERRRELFLESHRLGDMRRLDLPLVPAIGTPFPRGGQYGDQRCFPLPAIESNNNPNIPDV